MHALLIHSFRIHLLGISLTASYSVDELINQIAKYARFFSLTMCESVNMIALSDSMMRSTLNQFTWHSFCLQYVSLHELICHPLPPTVIHSQCRWSQRLRFKWVFTSIDIHVKNPRNYILSKTFSEWWFIVCTNWTFFCYEKSQSFCHIKTWS